jgi:hypothetical protein
MSNPNKIHKILTSICLSLSFLGMSQSQAAQEDWYFNIALGYGFPQYPNDVSNAVTDLSNAGANNFPIALDLGFYWPLADGNLIAGPAINGLNDSYSYQGEEISIIKTGLFFSTIFTVNEEPGDGFFIRGDLGFPRFAISYNGQDLGGSDFGLGALAGVGYGIAFEGTRLLFSLTQALSRVEGESFGTTSITVGGLF